ncbi:DUF1700 domain-containing protein [Clostridium sp.]|uniref:DUF1700 domain-containing protein n=1 Tax=Clostridium sp. TaxID=1506 RepID=UPI0025C0B24D|nr:DUF1700 domain-containing protein [Clostridium sp.]
MTKETFLNILKSGLSDFPEGILGDILYDYKKHFDLGFDSGKTDEEIIKELDNPYDIVNQYRNGYLKKYECQFYEEPIDNEEKINSYTEDLKQDFNNCSTINYSKDKSRASNNLIITILMLILGFILFGFMPIRIIGAIL